MVGTPSGIAQVKRDLGAISSALGTVGGGGSPNELRSDVGIQVSVGVEETLKRHVDLIVQDATRNTSVNIANQTITTTFSFPQDHYLQAVALGISAGVVANWTWTQLTLQPFADPEEAQILFGLGADAFDLAAGNPAWGAIAMTGMMIPRYRADLPIFVRANTDYVWMTRSGAAGITTQIAILHTEAPEGVEIAH